MVNGGILVRNVGKGGKGLSREFQIQSTCPIGLIQASGGTPPRTQSDAETAARPWGGAEGLNPIAGYRSRYRSCRQDVQTVKKERTKYAGALA
jgi:hypothetical protein